MAGKTLSAGPSNSTASPLQDPDQNTFSLVMPPTVIKPAIEGPSTDGKRITSLLGPHCPRLPPAVVGAAELPAPTTNRNRFPFGSGFPAASTPPTMSRI